MTLADLETLAIADYDAEAARWRLWLRFRDAIGVPALDRHRAGEITGAEKDRIWDEADRAATAAHPMPAVTARCGGLLVRAIIPQNRTMWRQRHFRMQYSIAGKRVSRAQAAAYLDQALAA